MKKPTSNRFVSRGGDKLDAAMNAFGLTTSGLVCADLGSHVGGFVDCLLQRGAKRVYSVDTSYGTLAWTMRRDPRVVVLERTNAMHVDLPEPIDLFTIDVGWTRQSKILPAAACILAPAGHVVSLVKPHYEADKPMLVDGVLPEEHFDAVTSRVLQEIEQSGWNVLAKSESPIKGHGGNRELFALLARQ